MKKKKSTQMLFLEKDDPKKEMEFELMFQFSLTEKQRYNIMDALVNDGLEFITQNGYTKTPAISSRE